MGADARSKMQHVLKPSSGKLRCLRYACVAFYISSVVIVVYAHGKRVSNEKNVEHPILASSYVTWTWFIWIVTSIFQMFMDISAKLVMNKVAVACLFINFLCGCGLLTFKHVILAIIPYSTIMYIYFLIKLVAFVFETSLDVSKRAEMDPIVGLHAAAKNEHESDTIVRYLLYVVAMTPVIGPLMAFPLLSSMKKRSGKKR